MKTALTALVLALVAPLAHADVTIGGPRQQYDAANCEAYRPVFTEFSRDISGLGHFEYGPEAQIPPSGDTTTAERKLAYDLWGAFGNMKAYYRDARTPTNQNWSLAPILGYDQLSAAFAIAAEATPGQTGPELAHPYLPDYNVDPNDFTTARTYRIDSLVYNISHREFLTEEQLLLINAVLLETPTCNGVPYPS